MHTVVVDIAIQGDLAKASASHFHTVVPFHDLLTIWFSFRQTVLQSAFRDNWYFPFAFPAYVFTGYPFRARNPPFLISKIYFFVWGDCRHSTTLFFIKQRKHFAVRRGYDPLTSAVVADMGFEPIREVLNIHLARLLASRLSTIRQSANDFSGLLLYTGQHSTQLN